MGYYVMIVRKKLISFIVPFEFGNLAFTTYLNIFHLFYKTMAISVKWGPRYLKNLPTQIVK
jgi:hypothetical protein